MLLTFKKRWLWWNRQ